MLTCVSGPLILLDIPACGVERLALAPTAKGILGSGLRNIQVNMPVLSGNRSRQRSTMIPLGCGNNKRSNEALVRASFQWVIPASFMVSCASQASISSRAMLRSPTTTTSLLRSLTSLRTLVQSASTKQALKWSLEGSVAAGQYTPINTNAPKSSTRARPSLSRFAATSLERSGYPPMHSSGSSSL